MRIAVLGPLEVSNDDGAPVAVPGRQGAAAPGGAGRGRARRRQHRPHRRCRSGTATGRPPPASRCRSTWCVCAAPSSPTGRRARPGRYVVRRGAGYALAAGARTSTPCGSRDLAARGRARLAAGDPAEAARLLTTALDLWRGEPYGDWPDAPFADAERRRLAEIRTGAVTRAARGPARAGRARRGGRGAASGWWSRTRSSEEWWRLLVLALYRGGRQGDALAALARARARAGRGSSAPIPGRGCARSRRRSSRRTPRWTCTPARRRARPLAPPSDVAVVPVQGSGHLPGGRRRAVPRPEPRGHPAGGAARRRAADRGVGLERGRQVLAGPGRPAARSGGRRAPGSAAGAPSS